MGATGQLNRMIIRPWAVTAWSPALVPGRLDNLIGA